MGTSAALLLAAILVAPTAAAWGAKGTWEPDMLRDKGDGWMFPTPDTTRTDLVPPLRKVYFNGFLGQCTFPCYTGAASVNPNVAALRTGFRTTLTMAHAMVGVWKDCDRDGYIGRGDQGLWEYRAELLADTSVCKPVATPVAPPYGNPPLGWEPTHSDGVWVREFLSFHTGDTDYALGRDGDPYNLEDAGAAVWADGHLPEADLSGAIGCRTNPQPRGTFHGTGGLLEYVDCHDRFLVTDNLTTVANLTGLDRTPAGQISFSDRPRDQSESASRLNVRSPWGEEHQSSYVEAWDCSQAQLAHVPVREGTFSVNVSRPRLVPGVSASGSPAGTVNSTASGFDECNRTTTNDDGGPVFGIVVGGHYHPGHHLSNAPYSPGYLVGEGDFQNDNIKRGPGAILGPRGTARFTGILTLLGRAGPSDAGVRAFDDAGFWVGGPIDSGNPFVDSSRGSVVPVTHFTFYASISQAATTKFGLTFPKGTTLGAYGAEACGGRVGTHNGWDCDAPWFDQTYRVRDIDCYDSSIQALRGAGVHWGAVTNTRCAVAP